MQSKKVVKMADVKKRVNVLERYVLLQLLPKEGTFANLKLLRVIREALSFNESENRALQFRIESGDDGKPQLRWNTLKLINKKTKDIVKGTDATFSVMYDKDPDAFEVSKACPDKAIFFGEVVEGMIAKAMKDLEKLDPPKLTVDHESLYEKFVLGAGAAEFPTNAPVKE